MLFVFMNMKRKVTEDMVAGSYNPDRTLSLGDELEKELGKLLQTGRLAPVLHSRAIDYMRRIEKHLNGIYTGKRHARDHALQFVLQQVRKGLG